MITKEDTKIIIKKIVQHGKELIFYINCPTNKKVRSLFFQSRIEEKIFHVPVYSYEAGLYLFILKSDEFVENAKINDIWDLYLKYNTESKGLISKERIRVDDLVEYQNDYNLSASLYIELFETSKGNISLRNFIVSEKLDPIIIDMYLTNEKMNLILQYPQFENTQSKILIKDSNNIVNYEIKPISRHDKYPDAYRYELDLSVLKTLIQSETKLYLYIIKEDSFYKRYVQVKSLNLFNDEKLLEWMNLVAVPKVEIYGDFLIEILEINKIERKYNTLSSIKLREKGLLEVRGEIYRQTAFIENEEIKVSLVLKNKFGNEIEQKLDIESKFENFTANFSLSKLYAKQNYRDRYCLYFKYQFYKDNELINVMYSDKQNVLKKINTGGQIFKTKQSTGFFYLGNDKKTPIVVINDYSFLSRLRLNSKVGAKENGNSSIVISQKENLKKSERLRNLIIIRKKNYLKQVFKKYSYKTFDQTTVIFESFGGKKFNDSPKVIFDKMKENYPLYNYYWVTTKEAEETFKNKGVPYIIRDSKEWVKTMAQAQYWVTNARLPNWMNKPAHTTYIQTWHGTPLKKLGLDIEVVSMPGTNTLKYKRNFVASANNWDYLVSPNHYSTTIFKRSFAYKNEVLEIGYPRNDVLVNGNTHENINTIKEKLNIPKDKKVILYAPTWRDNQFYSKGKYKFDIPFDMDLLVGKLSEEYVIIFRMHYLIAENLDLSEYKNFIYDFSDYEDISELYLVSDLLITDYSSVFFDYAILDRPMFFYAYDIEDYRDNLRGFYLDYEQVVPGPVVETTEALIEAVISNSNDKTYGIKRNEFRNQFCSIEDGKATERLLNSVFEEEKIVEFIS